MKNSQKNYATRLEFAIPIVVGVLLLAGMPLASATNETVGDDAEDTTIIGDSLSVIDPDNVEEIHRNLEHFRVVDKTVEETENSYIVSGTVEFQWEEDECSGCCIRQVIIGVDETVEPMNCIYDGCPYTNAKAQDFEVEVSKSEVESIQEEHGQATLIATTHSGWSCDWSKSNNWDSENEGIKVHRFSPGMDINYQAVGLVLVALSVVSAGGAIWYFKDEIPNIGGEKR